MADAPRENPVKAASRVRKYAANNISTSNIWSIRLANDLKTIKFAPIRNSEISLRCIAVC